MKRFIIGTLLAICFAMPTNVNAGSYGVPRGMGTLFAIRAAERTSVNTELFGLKWGMSVDEVKRVTGSQLRASTNVHGLKGYATDYIKNGLSDAETYVFAFYHDGLIKIALATKSFVSDPFGTAGKKRFEELYKIAEDSGYTEVDIYRIFGTKLFDEPDEFYECMRYNGCGAWAAFMKKGDTSLLIKIEGERRGVGYITLTIENSPLLEKVLDEEQKNRSSNDRKAFGN